MKSSSRWIEDLDLAARKSAVYSEHYFGLLGWLAWLIPVAALADYLVGEPTFDTLLVRFSAAVACLPMLLYRKLPTRYQTHFHIYFVCALAYCLPFTYGFILAMNAATTPVNSQLNIFWILQYFIALFLFIQLTVNALLSTVLWVVASALALLPALLYEDKNINELERVFLYPITAYLTALGIGTLTYRKTAIVDAEKTAAASAIGANLAHELRTPLASIGALAKGSFNLIPILVDVYTKAKAAGMSVTPLRDSQLQSLKNTLLSIRNEVEYSNTIIDMLLLNTADRPLSNVQTDLIHASEAVQEAAHRFPFNNQKERELVSVDIRQDFLFNAPRLLLVHVLFNLIKNSLYFVQKSGKGEISLYTTCEGSNGLVVVHDTGAGIPASVQPHIFERFYTTTPTGQSAGIGLSFCKLVMDSIGGSIACDSREGEYTTITLTFPNVTDEKRAPHSEPAPQTQ